MLQRDRGERDLLADNLKDQGERVAPSAKIARQMAKSTKKKPGGAGRVAEGYTHPDQTLLMRPEVGTQAQFRKKKPPQTYRYDSSLSPALDWDGHNGARELGEAAIRRVQDGARELGDR